MTVFQMINFHREMFHGEMPLAWGRPIRPKRKNPFVCRQIQQLVFLVERNNGTFCQTTNWRREILPGTKCQREAKANEE